MLSALTGMLPHGKGLAFAGMITDATWSDVDGDGDLDLYVANQELPPENKLFRNEGNEVFADVTPPAAVADLDTILAELHRPVEAVVPAARRRRASSPPRRSLRAACRRRPLRWRA